MATHSSFLPGAYHGQRSLVGYSPGGLKELDMTEQPTQQQQYIHVYTYIHTYICTYIVSMHVYMYVCVYIYIYLNHVVYQKLIQHCKSIILQFLKKEANSLLALSLTGPHPISFHPLSQLPFTRIVYTHNLHFLTSPSKASPASLHIPPPTSPHPQSGFSDPRTPRLLLLLRKLMIS